VLVHGTKSDAETIRAQIGELLARQLKMTLSEDKTHITHIDDGGLCSWASASSGGAGAALDSGRTVGWW
jgi:hypothetical protein